MIYDNHITALYSVALVLEELQFCSFLASHCVTLCIELICWFAFCHCGIKYTMEDHSKLIIYPQFAWFPTFFAGYLSNFNLSSCLAGGLFQPHLGPRLQGLDEHSRGLWSTPNRKSQKWIKWILQREDSTKVSWKYSADWFWGSIIYGYDVSGHCCGRCCGIVTPVSRVFRNPPLGIHLPRCSGAKSNFGSTKSGGSTDLPVNCCLVRGTSVKCTYLDIGTSAYQ